MAASSAVLYPVSCRSFPNPTQFDIHFTVAPYVTAKQRPRTVPSAWPAELLCQLACTGHQSPSHSPSQPVSRFLATAQHPQSLPSPSPSPAPPVRAISGLHTKVAYLSVGAALGFCGIIVLSQLFAVSLFVPCRRSLTVRIRLPARTST